MQHIFIMLASLLLVLGACLHLAACGPAYGVGVGFYDDFTPHWSYDNWNDDAWYYNGTWHDDYVWYNGEWHYLGIGTPYIRPWL